MTLITGILRLPPDSPDHKAQHEGSCKNLQWVPASQARRRFACSDESLRYALRSGPGRFIAGIRRRPAAIVIPDLDSALFNSYGHVPFT
jgi:hypothetical protein